MTFSAGIPLALVSAASYNTGIVLEKRALGQMPALDLRRLPRMILSLLRAPVWIAGFTLMLAGLACQALALRVEPVTVVQPLVSTGIALLLVLSQLFLRERLGRAELFGVLCIAGSVVLLAFSTTSGSSGHSSSGPLLAAVLVPSALLGLLVAIGPLRSGRPSLGIAFGLGTGLLYGVAGVAIKGLSVNLGHVLLSPYLYVLFGCSGAAMLIYQMALQRCRASILVPVSTITSGMYFIVVGTWLFHEHLPASPGKLVMRLTAIGLAIVVMVAMAGAGSGSGAGSGAARSRHSRHRRTR